MSECFIQYLGKDGKPSATYYANVKKLGHEKSLKLYLAEMAAFATAKKSKRVGPTTIADLISRSNEHRKKLAYDSKRKKTQEEIDYNNKYVSMSGVLDDVATHSFKEHEDRIKDLLARRQIAAEKFRKKAMELQKASGNPLEDINLNEDQNKELRKDVDKWVEENSEEFLEYKDEVGEKWLAQREHGSVMHKVLEEAVSMWATAVTMFKDTDKMPSKNTLLKNAKQKVSDQVGKGKFNPMNSKFDRLDTGLQYAFDAVVKDISKKYSPMDGWKVLPELYLVSDKINHTLSGRSKGQLLHGLADITIINEVTGQAVVYEYKTKSTKSANSFNNPLAESMRGIFSKHGDTAENQVKIQMSMASAMLEEHGYDVVENNLVMIESELSNSDAEAPVDKRKKKWYYGKIEQYKDKDPITDYKPMRGEINTLFDIQDTTEPGLIGEAINDIANGELEANFTKEDYIKQAWGRVKTTEDGLTWFNTFTKLPLRANTEADLKKKIGKAWEDHKENKDKLPVDLLSFFKNGTHSQKSLLGKEQMAEIPGKLLAGGITKESHILELGKDIRGLEDVGTDVLIATHKSTGEVSIMSLLPRTNGSLYHEEDGNKVSSTVFGSYMSDAALKKKFGGSSDEFPKSNIHNYTLMKLALVGAKLKQLRGDRINTVQSLKVITAYTEGNKSMSASTMEAEITNLKRLNTIAGKEAPEAVKQLFEDPKASNPATYRGDQMEFLLNLIMAGKDPLSDSKDMTIKGARNRLKHKITEDSLGVRDYELIKLMTDYGRKLKSVLREQYGTDKDGMNRDPRMIMFMRAHLSLLRVDSTQISLYNTKGALSGKMNTLDSSKDYYGENVDRLIELGQRQTTRSVSGFVTDMNKQVEALYKLNGVTSVERTFALDATRGMDNLYRDTEFKEGEEENWMRFKDPDDTTNNLRETEREFIRFSKAKLYEGYEQMIGKNKAKALKDKIDKGYIPLIPITKGFSKVKEAKNFIEGSKAILDLMKSGKKSAEELTFEAIGDSKESTFQLEVDSSQGIQGSDRRRDILGIDESGKKVGERTKVMTNPVAILTTFMLQAAESEYMSNAAFGASMVLSHLKVSQEITGHSTKELRELINTLGVIRIHNTYKDQGPGAEWMDTISRGVSIGMFWGNLRQMVTESTVGVAQISSATAANAIYKAMPNTQEEIDQMAAGTRTGPRFSPAAAKEAAMKAPTKLGKQLIQDLGLHKVDPEYFKSNEFMITKKKSMFRSDIGFAVPQYFIGRSISMFGMAQLAEKGILKAYELDNKLDKYVYKEENDSRFYVYDESGELNFANKTNPPKTEDEKRKFALWKKHRADLLLENAVGEDGRLLVPLTSEENASVRYYAQKMIPSMDASKVTKGEAEVMYRMALRFKRWMVQKGVNVWQKRHISQANGKYIYNKDADGNYIAVWEGQPMEGMINSLMKMVKDMQTMGLKTGFRNMDAIQKENLSKLLTDIILMILLLYMANLLSKIGAEENALGNEVFRAVENSIGDMMPILALSEAFNAEPFGTVGVVSSAAFNVAKFTYYNTIEAARGDLTDQDISDMSSAAVDRTFGSVGLYRAGKGVAELFDGEM